MLHACGWLEGGLVLIQKFVMDADQLGILHHLAKVSLWMKTPRRWTPFAKLVQVGTIWDVRIPKPTLKRRFGAQVCWITTFETWDEEVRATPTLAAARGKPCWRPIRNLRWIPR